MTAASFQSLIKGNSLDKLRTAMKSSTESYKNDDEGYWRPTVDKAGNGSAIIRFLPAPPPESVPFVTFYRHAFQGPSGWYIDMSRTTIGESDPCGDFNSRLWATKDATLQDQVRKQSRKQTYVSNIYVVQDRGNPANEGKVFLFKYGKKIFEKIQAAIEPKFAEDVAFDPFHVITGANFRLRQKKQAGFPNYDDSTFEAVTPMLNGDEAAIMSVVTNLKSLSDMIAPDKFKSYADLKKRLDKAMGFDTAVYLTPNDAEARQSDAPRQSRPAPSQSSAAPAAAARPWTPPVVSNDDDETLDAGLLSKFDDED